MVTAATATYRQESDPMNQPARTGGTPPRRAKHLLDPNNPRPPQRYNTSLSRVQTWVLSTLAVITILHMSAGVLVAALFVPDNRTAAQIGLSVIAGLFGVFAVAAGLAIHKRHVLSGWLLLGAIPTIAGIYLIFGR